MPFHWSEQASPILTVFHPWQEHDGLPLGELTSVENRLHRPLPTMLTQFYCAWGRRTEMTQFRENLFTPEHIQIQSGFLVIAEENQAVYQWGIACELLEEADPAVSYAEWVSDDQAPSWEPSHAHLSDFLDYLTYGHALACGAPYGGVAQDRVDEARLLKLQGSWNSIALASAPMGLFPDPTYRWVLYVKDGVVMDLSGQVWIAARSPELLEAVRQQLALTWEEVW